MKDIARMFMQLDQTTKTTVKVQALADYLAVAQEEDRLWTVAILSHRRPKRTVNTSLLRTWAAELAHIEPWLFEESYHIVGDLAETIALVLPPPEEVTDRPLAFWIDYIRSLGELEEPEKKEKVMAAWRQLDFQERFIFNKLITGGWRVGVSQKLMVRALGKYLQQDENSLAHRLMGNWSPDETTFSDLLLSESPLDDISKPYPFYLAYALEDKPAELGPVDNWQAERKWDGIRGQLIIRDGALFVWSRGEELITDKFPEYHPLVKLLPPGTVLDGEILPFKDEQILTFNHLQTRIGRKNITKKILESAPVILMAYDLIEVGGKDIRRQPLATRRKMLEDLLKRYPTGGIIRLSPTLEVDHWDQLHEARNQSRAFHSEGLMLKRKSAPYQSGRKRGDWWKWKVDPLVIDAVMIYAQRGHGRRANLYTDYTFAVWDGNQLVPFTKAYSGLTDKEFREVTQWVNKNTVERFGPVRAVHPELVFEIAFEGITRSTRHKSGVALRFPRISRWRQDKPVQEANTLEDLQKLLELFG